MHPVRLAPIAAMMTAAMLLPAGAWAVQGEAESEAQMQARLQKEAQIEAQAEYERKLIEYQQALVPPEAKVRVEAFHHAVDAQDRTSIATAICYPVRIMFRDRQINVENRESFMRYFDAVFTPRFLLTLKKIDWTPSVIGARGITIGSGQIWFDMNGCVVTFNNNLYVM